MPEPTYRIEMITPWRGKVDGKERSVKAGEQVDVDEATCKALVYQYDKATLVPVEKIIESVKPKAKAKPSGNRASRTRARKGSQKDKQQKASNVK